MFGHVFRADLSCSIEYVSSKARVSWVLCTPVDGLCQGANMTTSISDAERESGRQAFINLGTKQFDGTSGKVLGLSKPDFTRILEQVAIGNMRNWVETLYGKNKAIVSDNIENVLHLRISDKDKGTLDDDSCSRLAKLIYENATIHAAYLAWSENLVETIDRYRDSAPSRYIAKYDAYLKPEWTLGWLLDNDDHSFTVTDDAAINDIILGRLTDKTTDKNPDPKPEWLRDIIRNQAGADTKAGNDSSCPDAESAMGVFVKDMERAAPGVFGAWALDTNYRNPAMNFDPDVLEALDNWRHDLYGTEYSPAEILNSVYTAAYGHTNMPVPNPRIMFVFLNWGDQLRAAYPNNVFANKRYSYAAESPKESWERSIPIYGDWSEPLFVATEKNDVWSYGTQAAINQNTDNIGRFVRSVYGTPLWGGYMTDFYKGVATSDANKLNKAMGGEGNSLFAVNKASLALLRFEYDQLQQANRERLRRQGVNDEVLLELRSRPLVLATSKAMSVITKDMNKRPAKRGAKEQYEGTFADLEPWQLISWQHHSGSNGHYSAENLAAIYGRVHAALTFIDGQEPQWDTLLKQYGLRLGQGISDDTEQRLEANLRSILHLTEPRRAKMTFEKARKKQQTLINACLKELDLV